MSSRQGWEASSGLCDLKAMIPPASSSQRFGSQDPFSLLKIIKGTKFFSYVDYNIYYIRN